MKIENPDLLLDKIKSLERSLKTQTDLVKKYKQSLFVSNERIQKITENLSDGLSLLKGIHKHLIPVDLPEIPYFEFSYKFLPTSNGVSGDFFDVVKIKDSLKFAIIISNCDTYTITSLFLSSFLKSSQALHKCKNSKEFLSYLAKQLPVSFSEEKNINVFYGIVDRKDFSLDYCLVGNIFAAHKQKGGDYNALKPCTNWLSASSNTLKNEVIDLKPKDTLLFCSPGMAMAQNALGEKFGGENILNAAAKIKNDDVLGIRQNILFECDKFRKQTLKLYDQTILAVEVKERVLKLQK